MHNKSARTITEFVLISMNECRTFEEFIETIGKDIRFGGSILSSSQYRKFLYNMQETNNRAHSELRPEERFWTNVKSEIVEEILSRNQFIRVGKIAYDLDNKELPSSIVPLFSFFSYKIHPELKDDEEFLTNMSESYAPEWINDRKELRIGVKAYDTYGSILRGLVPIFKKKTINYEDLY